MLDIIKEKLEVNKLVTVKKEVIFIEGEMIVPDTKPDVLNTIDTTGIVCISKKEIHDEKVSIAGKLNAYIMYLPESQTDKVRGISAVIDFSEHITAMECTEQMNFDVKTNIKTIESRVINERKISIKASVELEMNVYVKEQIEMISECDEMENTHMLKEKMNINSLVGVGNAKSFLKETVLVNNTDSVAEILRAEAYICSEDIKISYNKILVKSELYVKAMYLTEEGKMDTKNAKIPIVGFVDIENVEEKNVCDISYEIKQFVIKPNQMQENSIYIESEIEINASIYDEKEITVIKDLYSTTECIKNTNKLVATMKDKTKLLNSKEIRERVSIEGLGNKELLDVEVVVSVIGQTIGNSHISYDCQLSMKFVLLDEKKDVTVKEAILDFEHRVDNLNQAADCRDSLSMEIENKNFVIQDGDVVDVQINLVMKTSIFGIANIVVIDNIEIAEEKQEEWNIVIYIAKSEDTLWSIAKKYRSTMESIRRYNDMEENTQIRQGDKLFIPKVIETEQVSKLNAVIKHG